MFYWAYGRNIDERAQEKREKEEEADKLEPFLLKGSGIVRIIK